MRKANQEITDWSIIEEILSEAMICRLAMIDKDESYLLPFNYGYKNRCLYIHSAISGKKIEILRSNPNVSFEIEDRASLITAEKACGWSTMYRSIVGKGKVEIIHDPQQKIEGLLIIMKQHGAKGELSFEEKELRNMVILKVTIDEVCGKKSGNWDRIVKNNILEFETERLQGKEIVWDDLGDIHALHSIPEVDEYTSLGIPHSIDDTREVIAPLIKAKLDFPRKVYAWKILEKESTHFIGLASLILSNDKFNLGEIYFKLKPAFWGKGYATEVAKKIIRIAFEELGLHKVEAGVAVENERSIRVLEKAGMKQEGLRRKILPIRGQWIDNYHYAILEQDH